MRAHHHIPEASSTPPPQPTPADRLRAARLLLELSQVQVAKAARLSVETVSLAERGAAMTPRTALRLAGVLGLNPAELVR